VLDQDVERLERLALLAECRLTLAQLRVWWPIGGKAAS